MRRLASAVLAAAALLVVAGCDEDTSVTAPPLVAECEASPSAGAAPLRVTFLLTVSGAEGRFSVAISYGDGTTGTDPDAAHVYSAAGSYTASMVVTTATQSARCSAAVAVSGSVAPSPSPSPSPGGNLPPVAVFKSTPDLVGGRVTGTAPFVVRWNMCATSDPERDTLYFLMDFDGDRRFDLGGTTGAHCRADHAYDAGTWLTTLCVHDIGEDRQPLHDDTCRTFTVVATP
jgi:hypothetical protein